MLFSVYNNETILSIFKIFKFCKKYNFFKSGFVGLYTTHGQVYRSAWKGLKS